MGYIGSHTVVELLKEGSFEPISIDSCINSSEKTIEGIYQTTGKRVINHLVDICDQEALFKVFDLYNDIVGVIHFAAFKSVPESVKEPLPYYHNNINALGSVLQAVAKYNVPNLIFSSSCSVYGDIKTSPVDENTPLLKAESPYAYTKQIGEQMIRDFMRVNGGFKSTILRYFNPAGADASGFIGESPIKPPTSLVAYITQSAVGILPKLTVFGTDYDTRDGSSIRDYIHVSDVAEAHLLALMHLIEGKQEVDYDILNIGAGNGFTVLEIVRAFEDAAGMKLPYDLGGRRAGDVEAVYSNGDKIAEVLGWRPHRTLEEMMESAWKWQLKSQEDVKQLQKHA